MIRSRIILLFPQLVCKIINTNLVSPFQTCANTAYKTCTSMILRPHAFTYENIVRRERKTTDFLKKKEKRKSVVRGRDCTRAFPKSSFHGQLTPDNLRHARPAVNRNFERGSIAADTRVRVVRTIGRISFPTDSKHMRPTRGGEYAASVVAARAPQCALVTRALFRYVLRLFYRYPPPPGTTQRPGQP